jgi:hypothetical protein
MTAAGAALVVRNQENRQNAVHARLGERDSTASLTSFTMHNGCLGALSALADPIPTVQQRHTHTHTHSPSHAHTQHA